MQALGSSTSLGEQLAVVLPVAESIRSLIVYSVRISRPKSSISDAQIHYKNSYVAIKAVIRI